jgi:hypothetical protein
MDLKFFTPASTTLIHFFFEDRKVKDEELIIDPVTYRDWEEIKPSPNAFR